MALFPIHEYFILNTTVQAVTKFVHSENEGGVYEVLRVVEGVPLFWEDHFQRLLNSAKIAGLQFNFTEVLIKELVSTLINCNKVRAGNILLSYKKNIKIFFVPHKYPENRFYMEGVECGILKAIREKPNAKVFHTSVREKADELINQKGFYEVILVDNINRITEGSRSNLFFIRGNQLFTSPGNEVLLGITRQKTIQLAKLLGIECVEKEILLDELETFDAMFITGTSPKILPVNKIDNILFDSKNEILQTLIKEYDECITSYSAGNSRSPAE